MEPLSFQEYICSLDPTTLPRILRICSGVYFQGSVYEIAGNECCLATGDLLQVTAIELQKVICEDTETGQTTELLSTFQGLFQPAPAPGTHRAPREQLPEGGSQRGLTLRQVLGQWDGRPQPLLCPAIGPHILLLQPVYEVRAAMQLRRDAVRIPSTLEVDVEDVTEQAQHVRFARPLLLSDLLRREELLPTQAEVLEAPPGPAAFQSPWLSRLRRGQLLQLHGRSGAWRVLASAPGSRRHFLLSSAYGGRFRRRPRQFAGVRELAGGLRAGQGLRVVVTRDCEARGRHGAPLGLGDRLEARGLRGSGPGTRLLCRRLGEEEEEEGEELLLPLDLGGGFVEETSGSKKYGLAELLARQPLPCEVRVAAPDPQLEQDELGALPALRLEARLEQPFLVGSFCQRPQEGFEIPPRWIDFPVVLREGPVQPPGPCTRRSRVEELTETFYYQLLAQLPGGSVPPPPRPPKPAQAGTGPGERPSARGPPAPAAAPAPAQPPRPGRPAGTPRGHRHRERRHRTRLRDRRWQHAKDNSQNADDFSFLVLISGSHPASKHCETPHDIGSYLQRLNKLLQSCRRVTTPQGQAAHTPLGCPWLRINPRCAVGCPLSCHPWDSPAAPDQHTDGWPPRCH
ncbi:protein THEMIS2 isoform X1 [Apus apus]|uniref:protein THEMIS2 isoform X1 n=1 Tax=Apus apus TaxID=8895 RepID=UPI0021F8B5E4|nr:protein THEMIS2 isoform X1 [Apus apus]